MCIYKYKKFFLCIENSKGKTLVLDLPPLQQQVSSHKKRYHSTIIIAARHGITSGETYRLHLLPDYFHLVAEHDDGGVGVHPYYSLTASPCCPGLQVPYSSLVAFLVVHWGQACEGSESPPEPPFGC